MAGRLAFVKVVALLAHVNTGAAWVLALHFITRLACLVVTRRAWALWATLAAWRATIACTITCAITRVLPWLAGVRCAWATAVVATAVFTAASIHAVLWSTTPATAIAATSTTNARCMSCSTTGRLSGAGIPYARHHLAARCFGRSHHHVTAWRLAQAAPDGLAAHRQRLSALVGVGFKARHLDDINVLLGKALNVLHKAFFIQTLNALPSRTLKWYA